MCSSAHWAPCLSLMGTSDYLKIPLSGPLYPVLAPLVKEDSCFSCLRELTILPIVNG